MGGALSSINFFESKIMLTNDQKTKLAKARYTLYKKQPFFWQLIHYLKLRPSKVIPTAAVDINGNMPFNMKLFDECDNDDLTFILAHELMHLVTTTHKRFPVGADFRLWNIASDIAINKIIIDKAGIPNIKVLKCLYGPDFAKYDNWTTEKIYYDLLENGCKAIKVIKCKGECQQGDQDDDGQGKPDPNGCPGHHYSGNMKNPHQKGGDFDGYWWDDSGAEVSKGGKEDEQKAEQWRQRVASAKQAGRVSGEFEDFLTSLMQPQRDWRKELRQFVSTNLRRKGTWMRPGKRTTGLGIRTPSKDRENPTCVAYCDTSGSMSDETLRACLSEVSAICNLSGGKVRLILGDSEIYYDGMIENSDFSKLKVKRGGTDFCVLFDHIAKSDDKAPKLLIGFTDAYGPFPEKHPDYPVIWVLLKDKSAVPPWGHVIEIED